MITIVFIITTTIAISYYYPNSRRRPTIESLRIKTWVMQSNAHEYGKYVDTLVY